MNVAEIKDRLAARADDVAQYLLPNGKKAGKEWKAGSVSGEAGGSLSVCIGGAKAGVWSDFASGESGDLVDLWMACHGVTLSDALKEAKDYLGIREVDQKPPQRTYTLPPKPRGKLAAASPGRALEWLQGRGLTTETIEAFKVVEQVRGEAVYAVFPYLSETGEYLNGKTRNIDNKRDMRQEKDAMPCLFGWHLINHKARAITICEGEIDAMTLHQAGIPALSVNAGAGNHQWIENDWERLERFSDITLCFDHDEAGDKGAIEVLRRLGIERCRRVSLPVKDPNDWLLQGATPEQFKAAIAAAKALDPEELVSADDHTEAVIAEFYPPEGRPKMPRLYVDKHLDWFEFHPGEYTAWTGWNGHGKSLFLDQVLLGLMKQGQRVVVFSGELTAVRHLKRVHKQASGIDRPTPQYMRAIGAWLRDRMWIFDVVGNAKLARLLEVFSYAARRYGANHFVIDSLMMLDIPSDGPGALSAQKVAAQKIAGFARGHGVHVHLVAHPRKGRDESHPPTKMDVAGSLDIINAADNVFAVFRVQKDEATPDPTDEAATAKWREQQDAPDGKLVLSKNRHGDFQDYTQMLWFHKESQQYRTQLRRFPLSFVEFSTEESFHDQLEQAFAR
ncbi:toprim domain-containing protein [Acidovorax sp.]|uniref:toprim domain-containing protein n=1 Tax=Acidovorax sp. TaxID=1872122 RepID=UPI00391F1E85